jgi:transcriptional regulator with XRE-family HTH domain
MSDDPEFVDSIEHHLKQRTLLHHLFGLRSSKGISQKTIAERMGCSQSRVSKLENGTDDELRLGELRSYAQALRLDMGLVFTKSGNTDVELIKAHAILIKRLLSRMCAFAKRDDDIADAFAAFLGEAFFNLVKMLQDSAKDVPPNADGKSRVTIEMFLDEEPREMEEELTQSAEPSGVA